MRKKRTDRKFPKEILKFFLKIPNKPNPRNRLRKILHVLNVEDWAFRVKKIREQRSVGLRQCTDRQGQTLFLQLAGEMAVLDRKVCGA